MSDIQTVTNPVEPDEQTKERIRNLAIVGTAITQISNDMGGNTDYLLAKTSLKNFKEGIDRLALDPKSKEGMNNLIVYLDKKIDKRIGQSNHSA